MVSISGAESGHHWREVRKALKRLTPKRRLQIFGGEKTKHKGTELAGVRVFPKRRTAGRIA